MTIDLSPLLAELDAAIEAAERALLSAQLRLAELRGQRAGVLLAVRVAQEEVGAQDIASLSPVITEGVDS